MAIEHIVVFGGGAIGSLYAGRLAAVTPRTGIDVTLVARETHAEAIARDGLRVDGIESLVVRLTAVPRLTQVRPRTLVLLTTKVNDNQAAAAALGPLLRDDTVVLCVQNGLDGERIFAAALTAAAAARPAVIRAVTQCGAIFVGPGVIDCKVLGSTLVDRHPHSVEIVAILNASGLDGRISDDIRRDVWRKLIFNCVINPITSIAGTTVGGIVDDRLDPLKRLVIDECLAVARADGVVFEVDFMKALADVFGASRNIASMRQDLMRGRKTEIDHMNGAVVALGARHGIACPVNAALAALITAMEGKIAAA